MREYYRDLLDRAAKSAAQGALLSLPVESAQANAFAFDWRLALGMAGGMAILSVLTNVAQRGLSGTPS